MPSFAISLQECCQPGEDQLADTSGGVGIPLQVCQWEVQQGQGSGSAGRDLTEVEDRCLAVQLACVFCVWVLACSYIYIYVNIYVYNYSLDFKDTYISLFICTSC